MQPTVFQVEPQGGSGSIPPVAAAGQQGSAAKAGEHFATVFVDPDTASFTGAQEIALEVTTPNLPPDAPTLLPAEDYGLPGLTPRFAANRDFVSMTVAGDKEFVSSPLTGGASPSPPTAVLGTLQVTPFRI